MDRRDLLKVAGTSAAFALGAGTPQVLGSRVTPQSVYTAPDGGSGSVGFGWECTLNNNGADIYFAVAKSMVVDTVDIDASFMLLSTPSAARPVGVLFAGFFSFGGAPTLGPAPTAGMSTTDSASFGAISVYNPNSLAIQGVSSGSTHLSNGLFYAVSTKAFAPTSGTGAHDARHAHITPNVTLGTSDYVGFHMDGYGTNLDGEMQIAIGYHLL